MSELDEIVRWSADPDAPEGMRELLRAANAAEAGPTQAELASLGKRMAAQLAPKAAVFAARTLIVGILVVGAGIAVVVGYTQRSDHRTPMILPTLPAVPPPSPPAPVVEPAAPPPIVVIAPPVPKPVKPKPGSPPVVIQAPVALPKPSEVAILEQARAALRASDAAHALALISEAAADYPDGVLVEEREALAIEALIKLDRRVEATTRWEKFATSYPHSNYRARLQRLIEK